MKRTYIALNTNTYEDNFTYWLANGSEPVTCEFHTSTCSVQRASTGVTVSLSNCSTYHPTYLKTI